MKSFNNVILIFPEDPSIKFLYPIVDFLKSYYPNLAVCKPTPNKIDLEVADDTELVIFLGHGSSAKLFGALDENGDKSNFLDVIHASRLFEDISIILLSCNSNKFIRSVKRTVSLTASLGFGDMPTDWQHISSLRDENAAYLAGFEEEHLDFYRTCLVNSFIEGLTFCGGNNPIRNLYLGIKYSVNKYINDIILNKGWSKGVKLEMIRLLSDLKNEIVFH